MTIEKIKFNNLIDVVNFSRFAEKNLLHSDINMMCGNICIDAKSLLGMSSIDISKRYNIQIISSEASEIALFEDYVLKNILKGGGKVWQSML